MKKLLLAVFLLTSGALTSGALRAQSGDRTVTHVPRPVQEAFDAEITLLEEEGYQLVRVQWIRRKNVYTASYEIFSGGRTRFFTMSFLASGIIL